MRSRKSLYLFTIPALLVIAVFFVYPIGLTLQMSFTNYSGIGVAETVGWKNYDRIFSRSRYLDEIKITLWFTVIVVTALTVTGLFFAAMLHRLPLIRNFARAALYTPAMMSFVVVGYIWQFIYSPLNGGLNVALRQIGLGALEQNWLGDPAIALYAVAATQIWMFSGFTCAIFLAGFAGIPEEINEAGRLEGASSWQRFRYLELPLLGPSFTVSIILTTIGTLKTFELPYILTKGGPDGATRTLSIEIIDNLFGQYKFGFASALSIIMLIVVLAVAFVQNKVLRDRENVT
ncbi:sugar ABC transporter permease [Marinovum sp. 2_MG-2023]|uniref:carbohydrate ABC transporter permease n=1 Tax=Roseobacteraceae TaxID=2854170 RepID=UPI001FCF841A|nr:MULTISPECIES: sugar ABC transporter permease [Roseobacteraceae]MCJ7874520.1 sugar ABC transporter permease [Phaeobacter sp. J2-8]MDO6732299.1 sugar ABC transporter permease [Marinovum sp. 2_MG-2023]MDO6781616.1 sugar ABC transporter permease [Marinovum sp. 1_MG-2023]